MSAERLFVGVANDKGGVGKSLTSALLLEDFAAASKPWHLVEIEQRANFTQQNYQHPSGTQLTAIALLALNEGANQTEPSLTPLDALWDLIPADGEGSSRILVDFGASAFQSFLLWGLQRRGLQPFRKAGFQFVFFIPVQAGDAECAEFFNMNAPVLMKLGRLVVIKNLREGADFSLINGELASQVPNVTLMHRGRPLTNELQQPNRRLTFKQLSQYPSASRRARLDAEECAEHFTEQLTTLRPHLGL